MKLTLLLIVLAVLWMALRSLESRTLYYPEREIIATPKAYGMAFEDLSLVARDGTKIHAWFIPATPSKKPSSKIKTAPTLVFSHGNAGNISHRLEKLRLFHEMGAHVLIFDYRGYGQSAGKPSEQGTYADVDAAYQSLMDRGIPSESVIFYGESLGCAVALEAAVRHGGAGLILESPFTSTMEMGKRVFPWLPVKWIVRYRYDNLSKISKLRMPLLMLHSPQDEIIPVSMERSLFDQAPEPKRFVALTGGHNDGYEVSGPVYIQAVAQFLKGVHRD